MFEFRNPKSKIATVSHVVRFFSLPSLISFIASSLNSSLLCLLAKCSGTLVAHNFIRGVCFWVHAALRSANVRVVNFYSRHITSYCCGLAAAPLARKAGRYMHMKKTLTLLLFIAMNSFADCPEQRDLDIQTKVIENGVLAGGNHGHMDVVEISVPKETNGYPLENIQLTYGEVSEYWIPLATKNIGDRIIASISGYPDSIKSFEFWVNYSNGSCSLYEAGSIGSAYNQQLKEQDAASGAL